MATILIKLFYFFNLFLTRNGGPDETLRWEGNDETLNSKIRIMAFVIIITKKDKPRNFRLMH